MPSASPGPGERRGEAASLAGVYLTVRLLGDELSESQFLHGGVGQNGRIRRLTAAFDHGRLEGRQKTPGRKKVILVLVDITMVRFITL